MAMTSPSTNRNRRFSLRVKVKGYYRLLCGWALCFISCLLDQRPEYGADQDICGGRGFQKKAGRMIARRGPMDVMQHRESWNSMSVSKQMPTCQSSPRVRARVLGGEDRKCRGSVSGASAGRLPRIERRRPHA